MKSALISLSFVFMLAACATGESEELKAVKEQNALLKAQLEKKEQTATATQSAPATTTAADCVPIRKIKNDLIGLKVVTGQKGLFRKRYWEFAALSEFEGVKTESENSTETLCEKTLQLDLKDLKSNERKSMRLYVRYSKGVNNYWLLEKYDCLQFN